LAEKIIMRRSKNGSKGGGPTVLRKDARSTLERKGLLEHCLKGGWTPHTRESTPQQRGKENRRGGGVEKEDTGKGK